MTTSVLKLVLVTLALLANEAVLADQSGDFEKSFVTLDSEASRRTTATDFGAKCDDITDDTAALQAALDARRDISLPENSICRFTTLMVKRNSRLHGAGRNSVLRHTGTGVAITLADSSTKNLDGTTAYIDEGWVILQDFTLLANGTVAIDAGKNRSSFTELTRVYLRQSIENQVGSVGFRINNRPWSATYSTYAVRIQHSNFRSFETAIELTDTVNFIQIEGNWFLQDKHALKLDKVASLNFEANYVETNLSGARGIIYGKEGGNAITVTANTFEMTNKDGSARPQDWTAGGFWVNINARNNKYLLVKDGDAVEGTKYIGTVPSTYVEDRHYLSLQNSYQPLRYAPGAAYLQNGAPGRFGGAGFGNGKILLGRSDTDTADAQISHDGVNNILYDSYGGGHRFRVNGGPDRLVIEPNTAAVRAGADNKQQFGTPSVRWRESYVVTMRPGDGSVIWTSGPGTPEGIVTAPKGSLFTRTDAPDGAACLYIKQTGSGNTGWVLK